MANYASLRGPVGMNRVYASVPNGELSSGAWLEALKQGRTFATNGPLLDFSLAETPIGGSAQLVRASSVSFKARLRSIVPLDHAQIVCNGKVRRELPLAAERHAAEVTGSLTLESSGWCVLRAFTARAEYPVLDNFVYATTSPIYVTVGGAAAHFPADARYFVAWIEHLSETTARYPYWNSPQERERVLSKLAEAKAVFERMK
jgi:TolB protein